MRLHCFCVSTLTAATFITSSQQMTIRQSGEATGFHTKSRFLALTQ